MAGPHYTTTETQKAAQLIIHGASSQDSGTYTAVVTRPDGTQVGCSSNVGFSRGRDFERPVTFIFSQCLTCLISSANSSYPAYFNLFFSVLIQARAAVALEVASIGSQVKVEAPIFVRTLSDLAAKVGTRVRFLVELRQAHDVKVRCRCKWAGGFACKARFVY